MKKIVLGLMAAASLGMALPAAAQVVVREHRDGAISVRPAGVVEHDRYHHRHRVVWYDRFHHRHVSWR